MCYNGDRTCGILSPLFLNAYVDDLSKHLTDLKIATGCNINNMCMHYFMYADDAVFIAPSHVTLQKLIECCSLFAKSNDMLSNTKKSLCMFVKSKKFKDLTRPVFTLNGNNLDYVET